MSFSSKKFDVKEIVCIAVMFVLFFGVQYLPPFGHITPLGMKVLGVFLGLLWGWVFVDLVWTSLLGFFILSLTGWTTPLGAVMSGFSNATTSMIVMSYCFAYCLSKVGVTESIAYWVLGKKVFVGKPWILVTALVLTAQLISVAGGSFAGIFLMWGIVKSISDMNGLPKGAPVTCLLYAMILYAGMLGGSMVPFMGGVIMYGGFLTKATGIVVEGLPFLAAGQIYGIVSEVLLILVARFLFRMDASGFNINNEMCEGYAAYKNSRVQKIGLVATLVFFLAMCLPSVLKGSIWTTLGSWGIVGMSILYLVFFNLVKDDEGKPVCTVAECWERGIAWGPILLFMVTIPLANAMESEQIGIIATVNEWITGLVGGLDLYVLYIAIAIVMGFMTQLLHNLVMGAIFIPIFAPIVISMGGNPITFFMVIYAALCCSFATPAASMQSALIFAHDEVPSGQAYTYGIAYYIVSTITIIAMIPLFDLMFAGYVW